MGSRSKGNWDEKPPPVSGTGEGDSNKSKWKGGADTYSWYRYKGPKMGRWSKENWDEKPPPVIGTGEGDSNKSTGRGGRTPIVGIGIRASKNGKGVKGTMPDGSQRKHPLDLCSDMNI
jgi:hypothetical protein